MLDWLVSTLDKSNVMRTKYAAVRKWLARFTYRALLPWVLASFLTGLQPILQIADLLPTGTFSSPPNRHDRPQRSLGYASQLWRSRLCWFDSLLFGQSSFAPSFIAPLFALAGINCRCITRVNRLNDHPAVARGGKQADNFNVGTAYNVPATQPPFRRCALIASMLPFSSPIRACAEGGTKSMCLDGGI